MTAHERILAAFAFAPFSRMQARAAKVESALQDAENAGLVRFVRNVTPPISAHPGAYQSDYDLFRAVA